MQCHAPHSDNLLCELVELVGGCPEIKNTDSSGIIMRWGQIVVELTIASSGISKTYSADDIDGAKDFSEGR